MKQKEVYHFYHVYIRYIGVSTDLGLRYVSV